MKFLGIQIGYKNQHRYLLILCLFLVLALFYLIARGRQRRPSQEGFSQDVPFVSKQDQEVFDDFLAEIYDRIHQPDRSNHYLFDAVEKMTQMSPDQSVILDAGSGTGDLAGYARTKKGYLAMGIDQSQDMVAFAQRTWDGARFQSGDFLLPMSFDKETFTHVFMTGDTIYGLCDQDKRSFFRNAAGWLQPHGFLVLELRDPQKWNPIPPSGRPLLVDALPAASGGERVTNSSIDFGSFLYKSLFDFTGLERRGEVITQEKFRDADSGVVRQNERVLYMSSVDDVLAMAQGAGFLVNGRFDMRESPLKDPYQYVFILEKMN